MRRRLPDMPLLLGVALSLRLAAVIAVTVVALVRGGEQVLLDDEMAYHRGALALAPAPFERHLPVEMRHLDGNAFLGLATLVYLVTGPQPWALRLVNAVLGVLLVALVWQVAARLLGRHRALFAAGLVGVWPSLVAWSALALRDTLVAVAVVAGWLAALWWHERRRVEAAYLAAFSLALLAGLREYVLLLAAFGLAVAILAHAGLGGGAPRRLAAGAVGVVVVSFAALAAIQPGLLGGVAHGLAYRQAVVRLEALGVLYVPGPPPDIPHRPGALVVVEAASGWVRIGTVQAAVDGDRRRVAFADGGVEDLDLDRLTPFLRARVPPMQVLADLPGSALAFALGINPPGGRASNPLWVADALAWNVLLIAAIVGLVRWRPRLAAWAYPACLVVGTAVVLVAVGGAPANSARHRAVQTVPLLAVFAAAALPARRGASHSTLPMPSSAASPAISRSRAAR